MSTSISGEPNASAASMAAHGVRSGVVSPARASLHLSAAVTVDQVQEAGRVEYAYTDYSTAGTGGTAVGTTQELRGPSAHRGLTWHEPVIASGPRQPSFLDRADPLESAPKRKSQSWAAAGSRSTYETRWDLGDARATSQGWMAAQPHRPWSQGPRPWTQRTLNRHRPSEMQETDQRNGAEAQKSAALLTVDLLAMAIAPAPPVSGLTGYRRNRVKPVQVTPKSEPTGAGNSAQPVTRSVQTPDSAQCKASAIPAELDAILADNHPGAEEVQVSQGALVTDTVSLQERNQEPVAPTEDHDVGHELQQDEYDVHSGHSMTSHDQTSTLTYAVDVQHGAAGAGLDLRGPTTASRDARLPAGFSLPICQVLFMAIVLGYTNDQGNWESDVLLPSGSQRAVGLRGLTRSWKTLLAAMKLAPCFWRLSPHPPWEQEAPYVLLFIRLSTVQGVKL